LRLGEAELSVSEGLCADRCVKKYMEVPAPTHTNTHNPTQCPPSERDRVARVTCNKRERERDTVHALLSRSHVHVRACVQVHNRVGKVLQGLQQPQQ
jgi:hypothetical protein